MSHKKIVTKKSVVKKAPVKKVPLKQEKVSLAKGNKNVEPIINPEKVVSINRDSIALAMNPFIEIIKGLDRDNIEKVPEIKTEPINTIDRSTPIPTIEKEIIIPEGKNREC